MCRKGGQWKEWVRYLIIIAVTLILLALAGFFISIRFWNKVDIDNWLLFYGSFAGAGLGVVGSVILGYVAIYQNKQARAQNEKANELSTQALELSRHAQDISDRLLKLEEYKENVCLIEFGGIYEGCYGMRSADFFADCRSYSQDCYVFSDDNNNFQQARNCLTIDLFFTEKANIIKEITVSTIEFNKELRESPENNRRACNKRFVRMENQMKSGCAYIPKDKVHKMELIFSAQDVEIEEAQENRTVPFWALINSNNLFNFYIKLSLTSCQNISTTVEYTVNIGKIPVNIITDFTIENKALKPQLIVKHIDLEDLKFN